MCVFRLNISLISPPPPHSQCTKVLADAPAETEREDQPITSHFRAIIMIMVVMKKINSNEVPQLAEYQELCYGHQSLSHLLAPL